MPMMEVLFGKTKKNYEKPTYKGIWEYKKVRLSDFKLLLNFTITDNNGIGSSTLINCCLHGNYRHFLLKNLCDYLAMFFITYLKKWCFKRFEKCDV